MQDNTADQLNPEMDDAEYPSRRFANGGKCVR
jgi:hypothetical protein